MRLFITLAFFLACVLMSVRCWDSDFEEVSAPNNTWPELVVYNINGTFSTGQKYAAHVALLSNISRFETLPQPGGCGTKASNVSRSAKYYKCTYATNGGFFNLPCSKCDCLGSLISNGKIQNNTGIQDAVFAVSTKNNKIMVGYINQSDIAHDVYAIDQLIAGQGWLVRSGVSFINTSAKIEHIDAAAFAEEAPRTMLGVFANGTIVSAVIDGEEDAHRGANFAEETEFWLKLGVLHAMNLDGGGSATAVYENKIFSHPTCHDISEECERAVTSFVCIL